MSPIGGLPKGSPPPPPSGLDLYLQQVKNRTKLKDEIYILKSEAMVKDGKFKFHSWLNNIKKVEYV